MTIFVKNRFVMLALVTLRIGWAVPANAAHDVAPSKIAADPASYEGKSVSVSGTVSKYKTTKTMMGTVAACTLCDTKCVVEIDETNTLHKDGDTVKVSGTFQAYRMVMEIR